MHRNRGHKLINQCALQATAIPQITGDFQSLNDMGWYGSSYLIAQMALLPTCGRIYTFFNLKWTYCIFIVVFELGSIVSAVAPSSTALIVGRAVTGLGAAGLLGGATIIMSQSVALSKRPLVLAIVLGMYNVAAAIGPLVGGAITDNINLTWRFIFWVNLRECFCMPLRFRVGYTSGSRGTDEENIQHLGPWPWL
jgi:MFS family permease